MFNGIEIAKAYDNLSHNPKDADVIAAYEQFAKEIEEQFFSLPVRVEFTNTDAYTNSREMFADIEENNRLKIWRGGTPHELMPSHINKMFRAVHDYYGHYVGRNNFSYAGETAAYLQHSVMFSELAGKALFTETIGQNSWYNFSETNTGKAAGEKQFAEQKAGLLI